MFLYNFIVMHRILLAVFSLFPCLAQAGYDDTGAIPGVLLLVASFIVVLFLTLIICPAGQKLMGFGITLVFYPVLVLMLEAESFLFWSFRAWVLVAIWVFFVFLIRYLCSKSDQKRRGVN